MTFSTLGNSKLNAVLQVLNNHLTSEKTLVLSDESTGIVGLNDLLQPIDAQTWVLLEASLPQAIPENQHHFSLTGIITFLKVKQKVTLLFSHGNETCPVKFVLLSRLENWKFSDSFSNLPTYTDFSTQLFQKGRQPSFLYKLSIDQAHFIITNIAGTTHLQEAQQFTAETGLNLLLVNQLSGPWEILKPFFKQEGITFSGTVSDRIRLHYDYIDTIQLGAFQLQKVGLTVLSALREYQFNNSYAILLRGMLKVSNLLSLRVEIPLVVGATNHSLMIRGSAEVSLTALADLTQLMGGSNISQYLPESLKADPQLKLRHYEFCLTPSKILDRAKLIIGMSTSWQLLAGLTVSHIFLEAEYIHNRDQSKSLSLWLQGVITIGGAALNCSLVANDILTKPYFLIDAELREGQRLDVKAVLKQLGIDLGIDTALVVDEFVISGDTENYDLHYAMALSGVWKPIASIDFALHEIALVVDYAHGNKSLTGSFKAIMLLAEVEFIIHAAYQHSGWRLAGSIAQDQTIFADEFIKNLLAKLNFNNPVKLPKIAVTNINLILNIPKQFLFFSTEINLTKFSLSYWYGKEKCLCFAADQIKLREFLAMLFGEAPAGMPDLVVYDLQGELSAEGFKITQKLVVSNAVFALGEADLTIKKFELFLDVCLGPSTKSCSLKVSGSGGIPGVLALESGFFEFSYAVKDSKTEWNLGGEFDGQFFGKSVKCSAKYEKTQNEKSLKLSLSGLDKLELAPEFTFTLETLAFEITVGTSTRWHFKAQTSMVLAGTNISEGELSLNYAEKEVGLNYEAKAVTIKFNDFLPYVVLEKPSLEFSYKNGFWSGKGGAKFIAHKIPAQLTRIFPQGVEATFYLDSKNVIFTIEMSDALIDISLPPEGIETSIKFDPLYIGISKVKLTLGKDTALTAQLACGLPKNLNQLFGVQEAGKESLKVFKAYDHAKKEGLLTLDLNLSLGGLGLKLNTSPFEMAPQIVEKNLFGKLQSVVELDLGDYGQIDVIVPEFSLSSTGSLKARGGFEIRKELKIPLAPLKFFLELCQLKDLAALIPKGIPLRGIKLYDTETKIFKFENFIDLFEENDEMRKLDWLKQGLASAFSDINAITNRLPDQFLEYTNINIPQRLFFDVDINASGSINFLFTVNNPDSEKREPIKLLLPLFPNLLGLRVNSVSFGTLFAGALFRLDIDVEVEMFDIPTLLATLLVPFESIAEPLKSKLPNPKNLQRKLILNELMLIIIYQSGVPIPIPLFYKEIRLISNTLEGVESDSSFKFPMPELKLEKVAIIVSEFFKFFQELDKPQAEIDVIKLKNASLASLTVGPCYIQLPRYLARELNSQAPAVLGSKTRKLEFDAVVFIAALLNAIKKKSLNYLIQLVPLQQRVDDTGITLFEHLDISVAYALTTPKEFIDHAYRKLAIDNQDKAGCLAILPPMRLGIRSQVNSPDQTKAIEENTEGVIAFLKGQIKVADAFRLQAGFGLIATSQGFGLGLGFKGDWKSIFATELGGHIVIEEGGKFLLQGIGHLDLLGQRILEGICRIDNGSLHLKAAIGNSTLPIYLIGELKGELRTNRFYLYGELDLALFVFKMSGSALIQFDDKRQEIALKGKYDLPDIFTLEVAIRSVLKEEATTLELEAGGEILRILKLTIDGAIQQERSTLSVAAQGQVTLMGQSLLSGDFTLNEKACTYDGKFGFSIGGDTGLRIAGSTKVALQQDAFDLQGNGDFSLGIFSFGAALKIFAGKTKQLFELTLKDFFATELVLLAQVEGEKLSFRSNSTDPINLIFGAIQISSAKDFTTGPEAQLVIKENNLESFKLTGMIAFLGMARTQTEFFYEDNRFTFYVIQQISTLFTSQFTLQGGYEPDRISAQAKLHLKIDLAEVITTFVKELSRGMVNVSLESLPIEFNVEKFNLIINKTASAPQQSDPALIVKQQQIQNAIRKLNDQLKERKQETNAMLERLVKALSALENQLQIITTEPEKQLIQSHIEKIKVCHDQLTNTSKYYATVNMRLASLQKYMPLLSSEEVKVAIEKIWKFAVDALEAMLQDRSYGFDTSRQEMLAHLKWLQDTLKLYPDLAIEIARMNEAFDAMSYRYTNALVFPFEKICQLQEKHQVIKQNEETKKYLQIKQRMVTEELNLVLQKCQMVLDLVELTAELEPLKERFNFIDRNVQQLISVREGFDMTGSVMASLMFSFTEMENAYQNFNKLINLCTDTFVPTNRWSGNNCNAYFDTYKHLFPILLPKINTIFKLNLDAEHLKDNIPHSIYWRYKDPGDRYNAERLQYYLDRAYTPLVKIMQQKFERYREITAACDPLDHQHKELFSVTLKAVDAIQLSKTEIMAKLVNSKLQNQSELFDFDLKYNEQQISIFESFGLLNISTAAAEYYLHLDLDMNFTLGGKVFTLANIKWSTNKVDFSKPILEQLPLLISTFIQDNFMAILSQQFKNFFDLVGFLVNSIANLNQSKVADTSNEMTIFIQGFANLDPEIAQKVADLRVLNPL